MPFLDEKAIREERANVWSGMAALIDTAKRENRDLSVEEAADYDQRSAKLDELEKSLERVKRHNELSQTEQGAAETRGVSVDEAKSRTEKELRAFSQYLKRGASEIDPDLKPYITRAAEYNAGLNEAGFQSSGSAGGYLVPQGYWQNLQIALKAYGGLLNLARIVDTATGNPMDWPTSDPTSFVGGIIGDPISAQVGQQVQFNPPYYNGSANTNGANTYSFGQGVLQAWTYVSGVILASLTLINDSAFDVDGFVNDRVGEAIGRAVAAHLHTGSGTNQPLGIQTALAAVAGATSGGLVVTGAGSQNGSGGVFVSNGADVDTLGGVNGTGTTGAAARLASGLVSFDDILGMIHSVDPAYRQSGRASWVMSDTTLMSLRSVTDQYGHPLWQPNVQVGGEDNLYGYPILIDQNAGSVSTTALTVGGLLFGDFQTAMVVRRVNQANVMRLTERYADALQVGYLGYIRMDARSNDLRAAVAYAPASAS